MHTISGKEGVCRVGVGVFVLLIIGSVSCFSMLGVFPCENLTIKYLAPTGKI